MTSGLRERVLEASGGKAVLQAARFVEARISTRGWACRLKLQPPDAHIQVEACAGGIPMELYRPADRDGNTAVLDGQTVRLQNASGQGMADRADSRRYFPCGRGALWWPHRRVTPVGPGGIHMHSWRLF